MTTSDLHEKCTNHQELRITIPKWEMSVLIFYSGNKGAKTTLETALKQLVAPNPSEELRDKKVTMIGQELELKIRFPDHQNP